MDIAEQILSRKYATTVFANETNIQILFRLAHLQTLMTISTAVGSGAKLYVSALRYECNRRRLTPYSA